MKIDFNFNGLKIPKLFFLSSAFLAAYKMLSEIFISSETKLNEQKKEEEEEKTHKPERKKFRLKKYSIYQYWNW